MRDAILFEDAVGEGRAALVRDGQVIEVMHRRGDERAIPGAVFHGRVRKVDRGLNAAFIDIGEAAAAFMRARDLARARGTKGARIETLVAEGDLITARVVAAPHADKGARVVPAALSEWGAPDHPEVGLVRAAPGLVDEVLGRHLGPGVATLAVSGQGVARQVEQWLAAQRPDFAGEVTVDDRPAALFVEWGVEAAIAEALQRVVEVPGGGRVTFDRTEALHVVDIDSGGRVNKAGRGALDTNLAAMAVVARHIRLRRLAGAIVVDAIRMDAEHDRTAVVDRLRRLCADDDVATEVLGVSPMGLIEVSRQRTGVALADLLLEAAPPTARADVTAAGYDALRVVLRSAQPQRGARWHVRCADEVAAVLQGPLAPALAQVSQQMGIVVELAGEAGRDRDDVDVMPG